MFGVTEFAAIWNVSASFWKIVSFTIIIFVVWKFNNFLKYFSALLTTQLTTGIYVMYVHK